MKYTVVFEEMTPQETVGGKIKQDRYGNPLRSIRIKQSYEQRQDIIERMKMLYDLYLIEPGLWGTDKHWVGNDPKKYTPKQMFDDFAGRTTNWKFKNGDLYRSFVDRHNYLLDLYIENTYAKYPNVDDLIELVEYNCRVTLVEKNEDIIKMRQSLMNNPLFDIPSKK